MQQAPPTQMRVAEHTAEEINEKIREELRARVHYYSIRLERIDARLRELEREWDIERVLETNAGIFSLVGLLMGVMHNKWHLLSIGVASFLIQHAIQGWCPPMPLFRRLGIRTAREINDERNALKALRGDYRGVYDAGDDSTLRARRVMDAINA